MTGLHRPEMDLYPSNYGQRVQRGVLSEWQAFRTSKEGSDRNNVLVAVCVKKLSAERTQGVVQCMGRTLVDNLYK